MWNPNEMMERSERAISDQFRGGWSPSSRVLMTGLGAGLFAYGLTKNAPASFILGALGTLLVAEGVTNADLSNVAQGAMDMGMKGMTGGTAGAVMSAARSMGLGQPATAGR